ncbi:MAG: S-layer homology domain-containing protein [Chroococcidiopsidaceae cyanobacterium CP_BM_ER_R8_30]|nr:S-layer homology domain-containing protein [Chroococcidiopsidaceae cyanobacterium CP_BM_ER_R8_30]
MDKNSSITSPLHPAVFVTALALTANILYPLKSLAQTPSAPRSSTSPSSGCLSGYPDGTYRGDRPVTRNEFAAGLNACLNSVNQLLPSNKADLATREDFQNLIDRQIELNRQLLQLDEQLGNPPAQK